MAWRRANWPTSRSPCSVNATTDGVVLAPSALGMTVGWPPSTAAITEFVVPRSMPTAFAIIFSHTGQGAGERGRVRERGRRVFGAPLGHHTLLGVAGPVSGHACLPLSGQLMVTVTLRITVTATHDHDHDE